MDIVRSKASRTLAEGTKEIIRCFYVDGGTGGNICGAIGMNDIEYTGAAFFCDGKCSFL